MLIMITIMTIIRTITIMITNIILTMMMTIITPRGGSEGEVLCHGDVLREVGVPLALGRLRIV